MVHRNISIWHNKTTIQVLQVCYNAEKWLHHTMQLYTIFYFCLTNKLKFKGTHTCATQNRPIRQKITGNLATLGSAMVTLIPDASYKDPFFFNPSMSQKSKMQHSLFT